MRDLNDFRSVTLKNPSPLSGCTGSVRSDATDDSSSDADRNPRNRMIALPGKKAAETSSLRT
jgi:hypothetical protein